MPSLLFNKLRTSVLDVLFPLRCVDCGAQGQWWCAPCQARLVLAGGWCCAQCGSALQPGNLCSAHQGSTIASAAAVAVYQAHAPLARLVSHFKYGFARETIPLFERLWAWWLMQYDLPAVDAIIPVPLHPRRYRERGFNQAEILAHALTRAGVLAMKPIPPVRRDGLERRLPTLQQARLARAERVQNMRGAFAWRGPQPPPGRVLLLDDVYTTGATVLACATVLQAVGCREVFVLTLCRSEA